MKTIIAFAALCLFISHAHCMQPKEYTIKPPYFDSRKQEYVIEAVDPKNSKMGSVHYFAVTGSSSIQMRNLEVDHNHRRKRIALNLLKECIIKAKELHAGELIWQIYPKDIGMSEEQLIQIYLVMLEKINPEYLKKATQEYRGDENLQSPWIILNLE